MAVPNWSPKRPHWSADTLNVLTLNQTEKLPKQTIDNIIKNSDEFPRKFPIDTGRCKYLKNYVSKDILERNINSVYPIIHENVLELYCKFILFKRNNGSLKEKALYENMGAEQFISRLLSKRAVLFMGRNDMYMLMNGDMEYAGRNWESVGSDNEIPPLFIKDCLTYDEIKLSAFLSVSSYTYFVNKGDRDNMGKFQNDRQSIEDEGIIIGLIGPRLEKSNVMEYQEIIINSEQNVNENGYGRNVTSSVHKLFSEFYDENCWTFNETVAYRKTLGPGDGRYVDVKPDCIFDNYHYYKRLAVSVDTLLMEANYRAKSKGTTAYVHVVGIGLGVWKISQHQVKLFMDTFAKRISILGPNLSFISDICFSYIRYEKCGDVKDGQIFPIEGHPLSGIKIHIFPRDPHDKLVGENQGKLLVVSYAWDGNALPGNEYWSGSLDGSSDPAAASSTQIAELHNSHINPLVCGDRLMVVTKDDVVTFDKYKEMVKSQISKGTN